MWLVEIENPDILRFHFKINCSLSSILRFMNITAIAILSNPKAGKGSAEETANWLGNSLTQKGIYFLSFQLEWPKHFDGFSDIWIIGGDGTLNYFINKYPDCQLPLAMFKCGTGNDFAWKLYGNKNNAAIFEPVSYTHLTLPTTSRV